MRLENSVLHANESSFIIVCHHDSKETHSLALLKGIDKTDYWLNGATWKCLHMHFSHQRDDDDGGDFVDRLLSLCMMWFTSIDVIFIQQAKLK